VDLYLSLSKKIKKNEDKKKIKKRNLRNVSTFLSLSLICQAKNIKRGKPKEARKKIKYKNMNR